MSADQLGITMEVYIDDMLVKSFQADDHLNHLQDCFKTLGEFNPTKCTFRVTLGKFLGYIVTQRGIEANFRKISMILDLSSLKKQ